jgi:hypothetical protein
VHVDNPKQKQEFLITRVDEITQCRTSKLKDTMPAPEWPSKVTRTNKIKFKLLVFEIGRVL